MAKVSSPLKGQMSVGGLKGLGKQVHRGVSSDQVNPEVGKGEGGKGKERVKRGTSGWLSTASGEWVDEWVKVDSVGCPRRRRNGQPLMTLPYR